MLAEAFPKIEHLKLVRFLRAYCGSVWHVIAVVLLTALSALFGWELPVYYLFAVLMLVVFFFGRDMLGAVPIVCCAPFTLSIGNNPEKFPETTILSDPAVLVQIGFLAAVMFILLVARIVSLLLTNPKRGVPRLSIGYVLLIASYLLGGVFSPYYSRESVLLGIGEGAAIALFYFLLFYAVEWKSVPKGYLPSVFTAIGFMLVVQILNMYFQDGVVVEGAILREKLFMGWGHYNYAGAVTAMCMPAGFYFSITRKHGWIFTVLASLVMLGVILTQSRGSILFGGIVYIACAVVTLVVTKKKERIFHIIVFAVFAAAAIVSCTVWFDKMKDIFMRLFEQGTDDSGRLDIFRAALDYFVSNPAFGIGWTGDPALPGWFYPGFFMAHNTVMQLLGSLGIVGLLAYIVHRAETVVLFFRRPTKEKLCIALCVCALLLSCMVDVHLFSFGPAILYSVLILFMEGADKRDGYIPKRFGKKQ